MSNSLLGKIPVILHELLEPTSRIWPFIRCCLSRRNIYWKTSNRDMSYVYILYFLARKTKKLTKKELTKNTLITSIKDRWSVLVRGILEHTSRDTGFREGSLPRTVTDHGSAYLQLRSELCAMGLTVV